MQMHDTEAGMVDEDWDVLVSFLPQGWRELARDTGALKGLRKDKTVDNLLRTLLLHLGCGHSLRKRWFAPDRHISRTCPTWRC